MSKSPYVRYTAHIAPPKYEAFGGTAMFMRVITCYTKHPHQHDWEDGRTGLIEFWDGCVIELSGDGGLDTDNLRRSLPVTVAK